MSPRDQKGDGGHGQFLIAIHALHPHMAHQVVQGIQRDPQTDGKRFCCPHTHHECSREPRSGGHRYRIKVGEGHPRLIQGVGEDSR